jgi:hypothetical protein
MGVERLLELRHPAFLVPARPGFGEKLGRRHKGMGERTEAAIAGSVAEGNDCLVVAARPLSMGVGAGRYPGLGFFRPPSRPPLIP